MSGALDAGRSSWRGAQASHPASTKPTRAVLFVLLLVLLSLFVWLVATTLLYQPPQTHLLLVRTGPADRLSAPPLLFEEETALLLTEAASSWRLSGGQPRTALLQEAVDSIKALYAKPSDSVVVYISANGMVTDDSGPVLLTQNFDLGSPAAGRVPVVDLLKALDSLDASVKLLVLDSGHVGPNARLGLLANPFDSAVNAAVDEASAPGVYVITACADLQTAGLGLAVGGAPLGVAIAESLSTLEEDAVSLADLAARTLATVARNSGGTQTPQLHHAARSATELLADSTASPLLAWRDRRPPPPSQEEEAARSASGPESEESGPNAAAEKDVNQPNSDETPAEGETPVENNDTTPETLPAEEPTSTSIGAAWAVIEDLRPDTTAWGPAVYAPYLWRSDQALLTRLDLLSTGDGSSKYTNEVDSTAARLRSLVSREHIQPAYAEAIRLAEDSRKHLAQLPPRVAASLRSLSALSGLAADLVRYHAIASTSGGGQPAEDLTNRTLRLIDRLKRCQAIYGQLTERRLPTIQSADDLVASIEAAQREAFALRAFIRNTLRSAMQDAATPASHRRIETLLQTPLLSGVERQQAYSVLVNTTPLQPITQPEVERYLDKKLPAPAWKAMQRQADLEIQLARLAGLEGTGPPPGRGELGASGQRLRDFYAGLPERLSQPETKSVTAFAILHPYDAPRIELRSSCVPTLLPPALLSVASKASDRDTLVSTTKRTKIVWQIDARGLRERELRVSFSGDRVLREEVEVYRVGSDTPLAWDTPWTEEIATEGGRISLPLEVRASRELDSDGTDLTLRVKSGDQLAGESTVRLAFPKPPRFLLSARCIEPSMRRRPPREGAVRLRPFPNRTTEFELALHNHSEAAKSVTVELLAIPRLRAASWQPGLLLDDNGEPFGLLNAWAANRSRREATPIAWTAEPINLPPGKDPTPIRFVQGDGEKEKEEAEPPPQPSPVDATHGLLCVVKTQEEDSREFLFWVELTPRHPTEYVRLSARLEDGSQGKRLYVYAKPSGSDADGRPISPPGSLENPVEVSLAGDAKLFPGKLAITQLIDEDREAEIPSMLAPKKRSRVRVAVDGYPRAMTAPIRPDLSGEVRADLRENFQEIAITSVASVDPERGVKYQLRAPQFRLGKLVKGVTEVSHVDTPTTACVFDVRQGNAPLAVRVAVDAPQDAFDEDRKKYDYVRVVVIGDRNNRPTVLAEEFRYADRAIVTELQSVGPNGNLMLSNVVADHEVVLGYQTRLDERVTLEAELYRKGACVARDTRTLVLDAEPPKIRKVRVPPELPHGSKSIPLGVEAYDLSGIRRVEAWVGKTRKLPKEAEWILIDTRETPQEGEYSAKLTLEIEGKPGRYYVHVRVTDACDKTSDTRGEPRPLIIQRPKPTPLEKTGPLVADLHGVIQLKGGDPIKGMEIRVEGGHFSATSDRRGVFTIPKLPAGTYKLLAEGNYKNTRYIGDLEIELSKPEHYRGHVLVVSRP